MLALLYERLRRGKCGDDGEKVLQSRLDKDFSNKPVRRDKDDLSAGKPHPAFKP